MRNFTSLSYMVVTCQLHALPPDSIRLVGKSGARFYHAQLHGSYMPVTWRIGGLKPNKGCNYVGYSPLHSVLLSVLPLASL